jgi:hypothetical protein
MKICGSLSLTYPPNKEEKFETLCAVLRTTHRIYQPRASISCTQVEVPAVAHHAP